MNDFEAELRARLAARARDARPMPDPAELGERIDHAAARHKRAMVIAPASLAGLMVVVVLGAVAFGQPNTPMKQVAVQSPATDVTEASTPGTARTVATTPETVETSTTVTAGTVPACYRCVPPGTAPEKSTTTPARQLSPDELAVQQVFVTLFDAGASDAQRLAVVDDSAGMEPVMQAIRNHPLYADLGSSQVTLVSFAYYNPTSGEATITVSSPKYGALTLQGQVINVNGQWKDTRWNFCEGLGIVTKAVGGPVLSCDEILNPPAPPPTTIATVPVTTTTLAKAA